VTECGNESVKHWVYVQEILIHATTFTVK